MLGLDINKTEKTFSLQGCAMSDIVSARLRKLEKEDKTIYWIESFPYQQS